MSLLFFSFVFVLIFAVFFLFSAFYHIMMNKFVYINCSGPVF